MKKRNFEIFSTFIAFAMMTLVAPAANAASATLPKFIAHRDYLVANGAVSLALGDLNGDGIPDLVAPTSNTNNVAVLLGKANGSFQSVGLFDSGGGPLDAVVADFNGDGKNDVAVTMPFSGVSIMLGDGQGHLGTPRILAAGTQPTHIVVADFNGDHRPDLAVTNLGSNNVSIFLGRGDGTFSTTVNPAVGAGPAGIVVGDFNGDGKVDLAVANSNQGTNGNTVAILLGLGTGRFQAASFIPVASTPLRLVVADFNKDTRQDIAVTNNGADVVSVLLGNGTGTFQTPRTFSVPSATNIGVADFNTDGNLDLVVVDGEFSTVALLLGNGTGSFNAAKHTPSGTFPTDVITGDFNHDGKADYITANDFANTVSVVLGRGNGTFVDIGSGVPTNGGTTFSNQIIAADFNNDGITDLAQVNTGITPPFPTSFGTTVSILLGKIGGGFQAPRVLAIGKNGPTALAAADLNRDGALDLAVTTFGDSAQNQASLAVLLGNGDGTFRAPKQFIPGPANPKSIAIADVNGDGKLDAIIAQDPTSLSGGISLLLGDGNGNFGPQKTIVIGQPSNVVAADFNRDRKIDIAYLTDQNTVVVQLGNGNGTFQTPIVVTSSGFTTTFPAYGIGDFNNDGILDFAVEESGRIEVLLGNGQGSFTSKGKFLENFGSSSSVPSLIVADFNGDTVLDVAVAIGGFSQNVSLLLGNGDGTLRAGQLFGGAATTSAVAYPVAGFQPGIAMACQDSKVRIIKNTTP